MLEELEGASTLSKEETVGSRTHVEGVNFGRKRVILSFVEKKQQICGANIRLAGDFFLWKEEGISMLPHVLKDVKVDIISRGCPYVKSAITKEF